MWKNFPIIFFYTPSVQQVHTISESSKKVTDPRELREILEPVQTGLNEDILSTAMLTTPSKLRQAFQKDPFEVLMDIRPVNRAKRPTNSDVLPILFYDSGIYFIGWQTRGALLLFNCGYSSDIIKPAPKYTEGKITQDEIMDLYFSPKDRLRSEPLTISDDEIVKVCRFEKVEVELISGDKLDVWEPLKYVQNNYEDNGDGCITDHATGLMWQQSGSDGFKESSRAYVDKLNRERFAGYSDWRLPTIEELASLLEPEEQSNGLYIDPIFDKKQPWCWSADKRSSGGSWSVYFLEGGVYWNDVDNEVRAVRSGQY